MNYTYLIGGIIAIIFGGWLTFNQIRTHRESDGDQLGWDIKLLSGGPIFIMIGIYHLAHLYEHYLKTSNSAATKSTFLQAQ
ncbi:MAG TPA: hypothetical protein VNW51_07395 [Mucilaginibacter sp.]|jgi:hypothetical protein|nr:hypothetical protein [Mucilaginibacter sp.]